MRITIHTSIWKRAVSRAAGQADLAFLAMLRSSAASPAAAASAFAHPETPSPEVRTRLSRNTSLVSFPHLLRPRPGLGCKSSDQ